MLTGLSVGLAQRLPEAERAVADGQLRCDLEAPAFEFQQQFQPALFALAIAVTQPHDILVADLVGADDHQQALLVVIEANGLK